MAGIWLKNWNKATQNSLQEKSRGGAEQLNMGIANEVKQSEERERAIFVKME